MGTASGPSGTIISHHDARNQGQTRPDWCEMLAGQAVGATAGQLEGQHVQRDLGGIRHMEHEESERTQLAVQGHRDNPHGGSVSVLMYAHKENGAWVLSKGATELAAQHLIRTRETHRHNIERREATMRLLRGKRPDLFGATLTLDHWRA